MGPLVRLGWGSAEGTCFLPRERPPKPRSRQRTAAGRMRSSRRNAFRTRRRTDPFRRALTERTISSSGGSTRRGRISGATEGARSSSSSQARSWTILSCSMEFFRFATSMSINVYSVAFAKILMCTSSWCQDLSLLHGLGIKFVIVPGTQLHIDRLLTERGRRAKYAGRYRITDSDSLKAAMEAAGTAQYAIQSKLSPGPPILSLRRHGDNSRWHDVGVRVVSGNFLAAKRRGVVDGIDYGATGEVKKIDISQIQERLEADCIVVVSNLGYSSSGEVLNCNMYEVATACALAIEADKMICFMDGPIHDDHGRLIRFLTLQDADMLIRKRAEQSEIAANYVKAVGEDDVASSRSIANYEAGHTLENGNGSMSRYSATFQNGVGFDNGEGIWTGEQGFAIGGEDRLGRLNGYLSELAAAAFVCRGGVQRVHLLDGTLRGSLLLELFTRDGVGTMVASDVYEGTRMARMEDIPGIKQVIQPLENSGALVRRTHDELREALDSFIVVERDGSIIACAALFPYFEDKSGEVACIAVSPECRGHGQGDKLLDYVEKKATTLGLEKLFLLTTRAADWFVRRGFTPCSLEFIPEAKRKKINLSRGSKYYMKNLQPEYSGITIGKISNV
ncbi:probable amino-acid acetyltransferase NAGS1, chloroplastic isoform X1 [Nymphaea colorata]|nr:probable amino-acid acetyltransferase NAGS1, chloroplastic isoform X1 [Nymphaea colorata]